MLEVLHPQQPKAMHKDKLAATKKHEEEMHDAMKAARELEKAAKQQAHAEQAKAHKAERAFKVETEPEQKHSKRALKEARDAHKKQDKHGDAAQCEHGVWKCKICYPHKAAKELTHGHERPDMQAALMPEDDA